MLASKRIVVDSHIFLDYYLDRRDKIKPLGYFAFKLIKRTIDCEFFILVSTDAISELETVLKKNQKEIVEMIFNELIQAKKIGFIEANERQLQEARTIAFEKKIPKNDALFAVIARDNNALLVSRDFHHQLTKEISKVFLPEEL